MKRLFYHGTTKENAEKILKSGYFKEYTYFANHLEDALEFGGDYVFFVWFEGDGRSMRKWQFKYEGKKSIADVQRLVRYAKEAIIDK